MKHYFAMLIIDPNPDLLDEIRSYFTAIQVKAMNAGTTMDETEFVMDPSENPPNPEDLIAGGFHQPTK